MIKISDDWVEEFDNTLLVHTLNLDHYLKLDDPEFYSSLTSSFSRNIIDGAWLNLFLRLKYGRLYKKKSGSRLVISEKFYRNLWNQNCRRILLLGGTNKELSIGLEELRKAQPDFCISGIAPDVTITGETAPDIMDKVAEWKPDVILLFLGIPKQEKFALKHMSSFNEIGVKYIFCFGGAIKVLSKMERSPPNFVSILGLEWFYKMVLDHKRIYRVIEIFKNLKTIYRSI